MSKYKRKGINDKGHLTWCTVPPGQINTGRCNHVDHQREDETTAAFIERNDYPKDIVNIAKTNPAIEKEHNQKAYNEATEILKTEDEVAIIQATGTGKSSVFNAIADDYRDKKILFIAPSNVINDSMKDHAMGYSSDKGKEPVFTTYAMVNQKNKDGNLSDFDDCDIIMVDELHSLGAEKWGPAFQNLRKEINAEKVIGASATPIREDGRDMVKEHFGGNAVGNLGLQSAIEKGILPTPKYVSASWIEEDDSHDLFKRLDKSKGIGIESRKEKLRDAIQKHNEQNSMHRILKESLSDIEERNAKEGKGINLISFCSSENDIIKRREGLEKEYKKAFPEKEIVFGTFTSNTDDQDYEDFKKGSNQNQIKVLFSVEKLNEGVHLDQVDGIMMLRKTGTDTVYKQQIGRALSLSGKKNPLIMDFANNYEVNEHKEMWEGIENNTGKKIFHDRSQELNKTFQDMRVELHRHNGREVHKYRGYEGTSTEIIKRFDIYNSKEVKRMVDKDKSPFEFAKIKASGQKPYFKMGEKDIKYLNFEEICMDNGVSSREIRKIAGSDPNNKEFNDALDEINGVVKRPKAKKNIKFY